MPRNKNVSSLTNICISCIGRYIALVIKHASVSVNSASYASSYCESENADKMMQVLKKVGYKITSHCSIALHRELFSSLISFLQPLYKYYKLSRPYVRQIMSCFMNSSLRSLDFTSVKMLSDTEMFKALYDCLEKAYNIEELIFGRLLYWKVDILNNLSSKLKFMPSIHTLHIEYICTPQMIKGLSLLCPNLKTLDVHGSEKLTDNDISEIAECIKLNHLDISQTQITGRGCLIILRSLSNLEWLYHCPFNCNSGSIIFESRAELFQYMKNQGKSSTNLISENDKCMILSSKKFENIKNFWLFNPYSEDLLLMKLCMNLKILRLDFILQDIGELPELSFLDEMPSFSTLKLNLYDKMSYELIHPMMVTCGKNLVHLDLHIGDEWFFVAPVHNIIAKNCHLLEELKLSGDYKGSRNSLEESDSRLDFSILDVSHPFLVNLEVSGVITDQRLRHILIHSPNLHKIYLDGELEWLHDSLFTSLIYDCPLPHLEVLWFNVSTTVTMDTVSLFLQQRNCLKTVGRLCHMAGSTREQYQDLLNYVKDNNLDTTLIWVSDERQLV